MRMLRTCIYFELCELAIAKSAVRQHATNGLLNDCDGLSGSKVGQSFFLESTRETGMVPVKLLGLFLTGDLDLFGIYYDYKVTAVYVRGVLRLVLAAQNAGDFTGYAAKGFTFSIDDEPLSCNFFGFRAISFHCLFSWNFCSHSLRASG
jgi:hypothetical protein